MRYYTLTYLLLLSTFFAVGQDTEYQKGLKAFDTKDYVTAFKLLKPFADSGDSMAEFVVGFCYGNPQLDFKDDQLAERYLLSSAEKFHSKAMGLLSVFYFRKGSGDKKFKIQSLVWAEIAGAYDPAFNATTSRFLIRNYLNQDELNEVGAILKNKKEKFDKISLEAFYALNKQAKSNNENSEKAKIPENTHGLIENPYSDWVYRWKFERFECDTMYYTAQIESKVIDSTLNNIKKTKSFKIYSLYRGDKSKDFTITKDEQDFLIKELERLKTDKWTSDMFPNSKCLKLEEIQTAFNVTENLPSEKEKNICSIVYTFSRPIFLRSKTIALFLDQKRYRTNYTQLDFSFYILENDRWEEYAKIYRHYESRR
jgi:hypothetical protein